LMSGRAHQLMRSQHALPVRRQWFLAGVFKMACSEAGLGLGDGCRHDGWGEGRSTGAAGRSGERAYNTYICGKKRPPGAGTFLTTLGRPAVLPA
jgi:hypothetical protein